MNLKITWLKNPLNSILLSSFFVGSFSVLMMLSLSKGDFLYATLDLVLVILNFLSVKGELKTLKDELKDD